VFCRNTLTAHSVSSQTTETKPSMSLALPYQPEGGGRASCRCTGYLSFFEANTNLKSSTSYSTCYNDLLSKIKHEKRNEDNIDFHDWFILYVLPHEASLQLPYLGIHQTTVAAAMGWIHLAVRSLHSLRV